LRSLNEIPATMPLLAQSGQSDSACEYPLRGKADITGTCGDA